MYVILYRTFMNCFYFLNILLCRFTSYTSISGLLHSGGNGTFIPIPTKYLRFLMWKDISGSRYLFTKFWPEIRDFTSSLLKVTLEMCFCSFWKAFHVTE